MWKEILNGLRQNLALVVLMLSGFWHLSNQMNEIKVGRMADAVMITSLSGEQKKLVDVVNDYEYRIILMEVKLGLTQNLINKCQSDTPLWCDREFPQAEKKII